MNLRSIAAITSLLASSLLAAAGFSHLDEETIEQIAGFDAFAGRVREIFFARGSK